MIYLAIVYIRHGIFAKEFGMGVNKKEGKNNIKSEKGTENFSSDMLTVFDISSFTPLLLHFKLINTPKILSIRLSWLDFLA